jgi:hypothetical protein
MLINPLPQDGVQYSLTICSNVTLLDTVTLWRSNEIFATILQRPQGGVGGNLAKHTLARHGFCHTWQRRGIVLYRCRRGRQSNHDRLRMYCSSLAEFMPLVSRRPRGPPIQTSSTSCDTEFGASRQGECLASLPHLPPWDHPRNNLAIEAKISSIELSCSAGLADMMDNAP